MPAFANHRNLLATGLLVLPVALSCAAPLAQATPGPWRGPPQCYLEGLVLDSTGQPRADITVTIQDQANMRTAVFLFTDRDGRFATYLPDNGYSVKAGDCGFVPWSSTVTIDHASGACPASLVVRLEADVARRWCIE